MSRVKTFRIAMCVGIASACCQTVRGTLITPFSVTSSTSATDLWPAINLRNDSGLSGSGDEHSTHAETKPSNSWATAQHDNSTYYYSWASAPVLTFQLDQNNNPHLVDGIAVWNYSPPLDPITRDFTATAKNCAKYIAVAFSQTGVGGLFSDPVLLPRVEKGYAGEQAQVLSFGRSYLADVVRLTILDNWHDEQGGGDRVGLSEVKFLAPEPSSLLLTGTGLFGLVSCVFLHVCLRPALSGIGRLLLNHVADA